MCSFFLDIFYIYCADLTDFEKKSIRYIYSTPSILMQIDGGLFLFARGRCHTDWNIFTAIL